MKEFLRDFSTEFKDYKYISIQSIADKYGKEILRLPRTLKILLENVVRNQHDSSSYIKAFLEWAQKRKSDKEIPFKPVRVLMQDFTGVPAIVDLAAMRYAMVMLKQDPNKINPISIVDLVIDHSVQVDTYASTTSYAENVTKEFERNKERYEFLKWGQKAFTNFRVVPPGTGICHQVNLEYLGKVVWNSEKENLAYPDTLVGTDSHTTMINGLSILGWGVGGIEAEASMLGEPLAMLIPEVIGFEIVGQLHEGVTATDLVLTITQILRSKGVVDKFVEFFGSGLHNLSLADRATIANMAPEYGATCGFFPVDHETIKYLKLSSRSEKRISLIEKYSKLQGLWAEKDEKPLFYTETVTLDLALVKPSMAGPTRPQDKIDLHDIKDQFESALKETFKSHGGVEKKFVIEHEQCRIGNGDVVIAAITSCTNTSNPAVMIAAGLVAKKAVELGLKTKSWVKTSLAPGSKVVSEYLDNSGLQPYLDKLGFNLVGYGCTTCIGNSGPLRPPVADTITDNNLVVASVLSGNRNFEGRIHQLTRANYLASPPLVVLYALTGTLNINLLQDPIGEAKDGTKIYMKDLWPKQAEINSYIEKFVTPETFQKKYKDVFTGGELWQALHLYGGETYNWSSSTYINNPPFFKDIKNTVHALSDITNANILAVFGNSITTDHISPAGSIAKDSPAAKYLLQCGVEPKDFNSYGSRRGNHEVMMRGTFANIRIRNELMNGEEGGRTIYQPTKEKMSIYDASMRYVANDVPLVIIAGKEYGTGSSRDWAAKGTKLLGVRAVIAESYERIHRSNLVGMGVLPLAFTDGLTRLDLNLRGDEKFNILGLSDLKPRAILECVIQYHDGKTQTIMLEAKIATGDEMEYIKNGGILNYVLRELAKV